MVADVRREAQGSLVPHYTTGSTWNSNTLTVIDRGDGCYVTDTDGVEYLDGLSGLFCTNLGHGRTDLVDAARRQMERLPFYPNWGFAHPAAAEAAAAIADIAPNDLSETFFVSSGSEAVESAIKFARNYHVARGEESRYKVIAREWAYHGTTLGALAVTAIPKFRTMFGPNLWDGARHIPNTYGAVADAERGASALACVQALEEMILQEGPETVAMVIAEPVQNGRGALVPPDGYWQELRRICDRYGILLCADEVINAFGRLGHWFGSERFGADPDMITFAKGSTSAYVPMGGVIIRRRLLEEIWDSTVGLFNHGSTFGGHPVAAAVCVATIQAIAREGILDNVLRHEDEFQRGLADLMASHPTVKDVRGTGYFYAIELMADRPAGLNLTEEQSVVLQRQHLGAWVRDARVLIRADDRGATMLMLSPPLIADSTVLQDLMSRVDTVLERLDVWAANEGQSGR